MSTARRLIFENRLGARVRDFQVEDGQDLNLIYRLDTRRVELHADLSDLRNADVQFDTLKTFSIASLEKSSINISGGLGKLRLATESETLNHNTFNLPEEDDAKTFPMYIKKSGAGHLVLVGLLVCLSLLMGYFADKKNEPELVTINLPKKETPPEPKAIPHVEVAEKKIAPQKIHVVKHVPERKQVKHIVPPTPKPVVAKHSPVVTKRPPVVVQKAPSRNVERIGALAALGGVKTGARDAEGLDTQSLKQIRSAGVGSGGGGIGTAGQGGMRGLMPGNGLIAGSSGSGGTATSAGGYGTRGAGGGKAGYGKISIVGGTSGVVLPDDEEPVVEGGLDRDQIAAVINRNKGQIIYCYEQGLQGQPDLRGRVSIQFVINPGGRISLANVAQSSLGSKTVESCMIAKMKSWQFPHPVGHVNVDVLYPFELRRVSSR